MGDIYKGFLDSGQVSGKRFKVFGPGMKLIVTDRNLDADLSPKPTIFLPSAAETVLHNAGTYLCLLENFFPDVIQVDWKEKNSNTILKSQQGDTIKTGYTFMKFSWLTVTAKSLDKEHQCIVKHEGIKDPPKVILFPSTKRDVAVTQDTQTYLNEESDFALTNSTKACLNDGSALIYPVLSKEHRKLIEQLLLDTLRLQLTNTSAYYTYLLLLVKSAIYLAIVGFCLLRRTAVYGGGKSP
ncbi:T-cell receptor gamma alternate reading frame protein [Dugong dugon]